MKTSFSSEALKYLNKSLILQEGRTEHFTFNADVHFS